MTRDALPSPRPPRLASWIAGLRLRGDARGFQLGALREEFADRGPGEGWRAARRWYWRHAFRNLLVSPRPAPAIEIDHTVRLSPGDFMGSLRQDISFAFRLMRRAPVATLAAIVTFALGLGANVAI